ncbi:glycosyltransferase family 2 protein [Candidatus Pacearchaeota archaeon]|nr:glycosyltransferase family 2 protein [Candidatus Pacearchaeota archaeon]
MKKEHPEVSIILPCRNEELALPFCLKQIKKVIKKEKLNAEIIVSDSSADNSPKIAKKFKTILIKHDKEGYGNAYLEAFKIAKGKYIFMADCDGTYDFNEIPKFIKELKRGNDLILGNRFAGKMEKDSMPMSNRYLGNPILSGILRVFFHTKIKDSHTGMRAIKKQSLNLLNLKTIGMEFASEMIIKSIKKNLKIKEIPIDYHKRKGNSKLKPYRDAWKHIRFMLLYSPLFLFFIPGLILFFLGLISIIGLYFGSVNIFGIQLFYHPMFLSSSLIIIGYQLIIFSVFAKSYAINHLGETESKLMRKLYQIITLERVSIIGIITTIVGAVIYLIIFLKWIESGFPALNEIKNSILALTLITLGIQTIFSAFMLSILSIKEK